VGQEAVLEGVIERAEIMVADVPAVGFSEPQADLFDRLNYRLIYRPEIP
jgi:hypothetical protein